MLTERERFISIVDNDLLFPSDAIILLEGDGYNRYQHAVSLYKQKMAPIIVFSGGITDYKYGSYPFSDIGLKLLEAGVKASNIIHEAKSLHTKEQADEVLLMTLRHNWSKLILVASCEHQYRAYLTFLKPIIENKLDIVLYNSQVKLRWFENCEWGMRFERIEEEFLRIEKYYKLGHLVSYSEAIEYQKWKEQVL